MVICIPIDNLSWNIDKYEITSQGPSTLHEYVETVGDLAEREIDYNDLN